MTDRFHYQDVFQTINIPETERHLAFKAKDLLDSAHDIEFAHDIHQYLSKVVDTHEVSQAFWEFENDAEFQYDRFVITAMRRGITLAVEHRSFNRTGDTFRSSLHLENSVASVHFSDLSRGGRLSERLTDPAAMTGFDEQFSRVTANLGLLQHIQSLRQSDNDSASFASAA